MLSGFEISVEICDHSKFCQETERLLISPREIEDFNPICTFCLSTVNRIKELILDGNEDEVKTVLGYFCSQFTSKTSSECKDYIEKYFLIILDVIGSVPSDHLCMLYKLCYDLTSFDNALTQLSSDEVGSVVCFMCEYTTKHVQKWIKKEDSEIKSLLKDLCSNLYLSGETCTTIIDKYAGLILQMAETMDPKSLCKYLFPSLQENDFIDNN